MADSFDIVDIVFKAVGSTETDLVWYKGNSITGEKNNHGVVSVPPLDHKSYVNKAPFVNINIFIKKYDNGLPNHQLMKKTVRNIASNLKTVTAPVGMYWKSRIVWSEPMGEYKENFDCTNIRLEVITELN